MTDNINSIIHKPTKDTSEETFLKGFFLVTYVCGGWITRLWRRQAETAVR